MKSKIFAVMLTGALLAVGGGCVSTVDGRSQAGVPFIKDKVEGRYDVSVERVVASARAVLKRNGQIVDDNVANNSFESKINGASVFVHVEAEDPNKPITLLQVEVRNRMGGSNVELAHDIEKQVALNLATGGH